MLVALNELHQDLANAYAIDPHAREMMTQLLEAEIEPRERRVLFFRVMRQPEMRLLRLALRHLDWDRGIDWQSVQSIKCEPYADDRCWMLTTDKYLVVCLDAQNLSLTYEDFYLIYLHQENDPHCKCEFCQVEQQAHDDLRAKIGQ